MKAFGKILGLIVLGLLLIIVAAGFALTHFFDPNDYKDEIRQLARNKAHIELDLKGDIGWSLFPWLGLELHDASVATLANPKVPFADLQMLGLSVRVLPLLRREVQMSDVRVEGLNLTLTRDANGHGNWEDIGKVPAPASTSSVSSTAPNAPAKPADSDSSRPVKLDIDSLTVNNATVKYLDEKSSRQFTAESIQLSTGAVHDNTDIPVKFTAFIGTNLPQIRARTEVSGDLRFDRKLQRYQFGDFRLGGEVSGDPMQGKSLTFSAQGQLLLDKAAGIADWTGLKLSANQLRALGELHARDINGEPKLSGALSIAQFNLRTFLDSVGVELPAMADTTTLGQVEMVSSLNATKNSLALDDLKLQLDGGTFAGRLAVDDFAKQALRVQLKGDKLDADRYLPPKSQNSASVAAARQAEVNSSEVAVGAGDSPLPEAPTKGAWSDERLLPIERLRSLDLQADLSLGQLTLDKLPITNASLKAQAQDGLLTLQTLGGGLFDGSFETHGTLDVRPATPTLALQTRIAKVPVEQFIKTQSPKATITGLLTSDSNLTSSGNSQKALVEGLNGTASFAINDGVLVNANLEQQLCQGIATLNRKTLSGEPRGRDTPFRQLNGSLQVRNGVASNQDLKVAIPGLRVAGNGTVDLRVLGLDYRIGVVVEGDKGDMPDPACQVNEHFANLEFPLLCRGPLELGAKACRVDREGLAKVAAKAAGDRIGDKLEEKLGDKVTPELKDAIKGLFKR
jgi:AsmA protein